MSGTVVHVLKRVPPDPVPPERWAFTGLNNFRICPRRWYLSHCHFDKFGGPLPPRLSRAGVEGDMLHAILEEYYDSRRDLAEVFRPRQRLLELIDTWYQKNKGNLRSDAWRLKHQVSIVEIVRRFWSAVESCGVVGNAGGSRLGTERSGKRARGTEVWLRDPHSKLIGRCDLIRDDKLVDFKSGEPQEWHCDQVLFYAGLLFSQQRYLVKSIELVYLNTFQRIVVAAPSEADLEAALNIYRELASRADELISQGEYEARPNETECPKCPVRMLCEIYCKELASEQIFSDKPGASLFDFNCKNGVVLSEAAGVVVEVTSDLGTRRIFFPMTFVSEIGADNLDKVRIINAALRSRSEKEVDLALTSASEAFVVDGIG